MLVNFNLVHVLLLTIKISLEKRLKVTYNQLKISLVKNRQYLCVCVVFKFLIASDMSLTSKPSWASKARAEEFRQLGVMASNLRTLAEW